MKNERGLLQRLQRSGKQVPAGRYAIALFTDLSTTALVLSLHPLAHIGP